MIKQAIVLIVSLVLFSSTYACDACSCTSMNTLDGQLLPSNKTFFGTSLGYVHQLDGNKTKLNNFSYNAFVAYSFAKRFQLLANLPFQHVISKSKQEVNSEFGLGDASLLLSVMPYSTPSEKNKSVKSTLILRTGIKFPTGVYDENGEKENLGTKSFDYLFAAQYILEANNQGLNLSVNGRINTTNKFDYKYGNQYNVSAFYFVKRSFKKNAYMPFAGVNFEYFQKDISNGFVRNYSGGKALYAYGGLQWSYNDKFSFFVRGELPVVQNYLSADGNIYSNFRAQVQLNYFIPSKQKVKKTIKIN